MKKIIFILAFLSALFLTLIALDTLGQTTTSGNILQFTRAEQDSILSSRVYAVKNFLTKEPKKKFWYKNDGYYDGNRYKIRLKIEKKDTSIINFFYFYLEQDDIYVAVRYWPKNNSTVLLIFTFRKSRKHCIEFDEMSFREFRESFTEADYFDFSQKEKPDSVLIKIPEVSEIHPSVIKALIEITDEIISRED